MRCSYVFTSVLACLLVFAGIVQAEDKPDVVFIIVDDLNDWIGCMDGHPQSKTPHMDALASRGTLFTNAHCQAPICGPSRGSFLSGLYPHQTGLYNQPRSRPGLKSDSQFFDGHLMPQYFALSLIHI